MPITVLPGFNPTLLLCLNLVGTFVFGVSGAMAGVRARLDLFGVVVLATVVGIAGGTIRDVLIGIPPVTFRDWRYLAVAGGAGLITSLAHPTIDRLQRPIDALDAAGLGLFAASGAAAALVHRLGVPECIILGAITGTGGGIVRDMLLNRVPTVLRGGLYAIPAIVASAIVVIAYHAGDHTVTWPVIAVVVCFLLRMAGLRYGLGLPAAQDLAVSAMPSRRRSRPADPS